MNYVDAFKTAPPPFLDLCPHAWNKLAYSAEPKLPTSVSVTLICLSQMLTENDYLSLQYALHSN